MTSKIFSFGSCRVPFYDYTYSERTHSTKDIIQILLFINNIESIENYYSEYFNINNNNICSFNDFKNDISMTLNNLKKSQIVVLEISSIKYLVLSNLYLNNHLYQVWENLEKELEKYIKLNNFNKINSKTKQIKYKNKLDKNYINNNLKRFIQTEKDIYEDLEKIINLLKNINNNIKIIIIPHINVKVSNNIICSYLEGENLYIRNRQIIFNTTKKFCKNKNITFFNPTDYITDNPDIIFKKDPKTNKILDYAHYNDEAFFKIKKEFMKLIKSFEK